LILLTPGALLAAVAFLKALAALLLFLEFGARKRQRAVEQKERFGGALFHNSNVGGCWNRQIP
jgi:hypothetical protein